uniref:Uncharacterized protein n=1 Tax=Caenorhabditis japonica TaxID=281687 RepID=A0A8R1HXD9_CAEJA
METEEEAPVSGACIFRAIGNILRVEQTLTFHNSMHIQHDEFYIKSERFRRVSQILNANEFEEAYTVNDIEKALEREIQKRDPTPPPRRPLNNSNFCHNREKLMCGTVSGRVFHKFMEIFLSPKNFATLLNHRIIAPIMTYDPEEQLILFDKIAMAMRNPTWNGADLVHVFQRFLEIPDVKAVLGHEFAVMDERKWSLHLHMHCSKVDRIRTEIVVVQHDLNTPPFVAKFLDLVLLRVLYDHRQYECAYFDNRKMAIKDRMEQLPTSSTFPEKPTNIPCKSALIYAEKFFRWAAETLEFEKTLTYSSRINYGYMERPLDRQILLRVVTVSSPDECEVSVVFLDDLKHSLRRYQAIFKDLKVVVHEFVTLEEIEDHVRDATQNRITFDLQFAALMSPYPTLYPFPGPYNRHVVLADDVLKQIIRTLMVDVRIFYQVDRGHPEVQKFVRKAKEFFPILKHSYFIDLDVKLELEREAYNLKQFKGINLRESLQVSDMETLATNMLKSLYPEEKVQVMLPRYMFVYAFPMFADIVHHFFCTSEFCYRIYTPDFKPFMGPPRQYTDTWRPTLICNVLAERDNSMDTFGDYLV